MVTRTQGYSLPACSLLHLRANPIRENQATENLKRGLWGQLYAKGHFSHINGLVLRIRARYHETV
jgi:hypothetical protein